MCSQIRWGRGPWAHNSTFYLKMLRRRARVNPPPPNPMADPIAHVRRPLNPLDVKRQGRALVEFSPQDVRDIRGLFLATQTQFARAMGIKVATLRNWESGRRRPHGPGRALLRAIRADPVALAKALNWGRREAKEELLDWLE